jgi:hypothetical protein
MHSIIFGELPKLTLSIDAFLEDDCKGFRPYYFLSLNGYSPIVFSERPCYDMTSKRQSSNNEWGEPWIFTFFKPNAIVKIA